MNKKIKNLMSNTAIFALGNMGSKLVAFIMIPFITRYLTTAEYGQADLIITTVSMFLPVVALSIADAVFRFSMDPLVDEKKVLSAGVIVTLAGSLVAILITLILAVLGINNAFDLGILLILGLFQSMLQNYTRGIGMSRLFAFNGFFSSIINGLSVFILVVYLHQGLSGYLRAQQIAGVVSIMYLSGRLRVWRSIDVRSVDTIFLRRLLIYSIPLIPNAFAWFFTNDASKFFISLFLGMSANGIYSIATKVPTIMNVIYSVFVQAWQMSASGEVDHAKSRMDSKFFSSVLKFNVSASFIAIALIIMFVQPMMKVLVNSSFFDAWKLAPALLIAAFYSNMSAFVGSIYLAVKETKKIFTTTILGMVVNITFNLLLIPSIGIQGAGIGACIGFVIVFWLRVRGLKEKIDLKVPWRIVLVSTFLLIAMVIVQLTFELNYITISVEVILCVFVCLINDMTKGICKFFTLFQSKI